MNKPGLKSVISISVVLCDDPDCMYDTGHKSKNGQQNVEPEMWFDPDGHENAKGREDDGQNNSKYAHCVFLRFVVPEGLFVKTLPLISCAGIDTAGHSGYHTSAACDNN